MGRPVTITLEHDLGTEEAKRRIDTQFDELKSSIAGNVGLTFERAWKDDTLAFTAKGMSQRVTGDIDVFPGHIRIVVVLPTLLAGMAEAMQGRLKKNAGVLLEDKRKT